LPLDLPLKGFDLAPEHSDAMYHCSPWNIWEVRRKQLFPTYLPGPLRVGPEAERC
jgi:hypothetical protein